MKDVIKRIGSKEKKYVAEVLGTDFSSSKGCNMVGRLEQSFSKKFGVKYSIGHTNGTATLHSALFAAGVRAGDEVIVPPLTMASTAMAVLHCDAVPVFADVNEETFQIDPIPVKKLITPRTKAIIVVSLYGLCPEMDEIMKIAKKYHLMVIEDDAQCFLGGYKGKVAGTMGHLSSFSFQSSKHMTSGEGGMVCTNSERLADEVRKFSVLGYASVSAKVGKITKADIQNPDYNRHICMGYNYRMSELCAAVSLGQLEHLDELVQRRIEVANLFNEAIKGCSWLKPQKVPDYCLHSYWAFAVRLVHPKIRWVDFRKKFMELGGDGIYAAWKLTYLEPMFKTMDFSGKEKIIRKMHKGKLQSYKAGLCPVAEKIQRQILAFKTNYWDMARAKRQAQILEETIAFYDKQ
jgi:perosamine synthetase